jgi:hypothetical protein
MDKICYLCGELIPKEEESEDHVVQHQFIKRSQPKAKGFDYAGVLMTHLKCNNHFGGATGATEYVCQKALELSAALHDENCFILRQHSENPEIKLLALKEECLKSLTKNDLEFFGIIELRGKNYSDWSKPLFFGDKKKLDDPFERPRDIILSVLAKSAAAILVKRCDVPPDSRWRILATPLVGKDVGHLFEGLMETTKPFEVGMQAWLRQNERGEWLVGYIVGEVCVILIFVFSDDDSSFKERVQILDKFDHFLFESNKLIDMAGYNWPKNKFR